MIFRWFVLAILASITRLHAAEVPVADKPAPVSWEQARSGIEATCLDCHNAKKDKGGVDLESLLEDPQIQTEFALWDSVQRVVAAGEMPPPDSDELLPKEKKELIAWVEQELEVLATQNAGDPGPVTMRRLTNAEYDHSIRDLTWRDFDLAAEFGSDGGGGEGFSNTGDVLFVSPASLSKYLTAARKLVDHATILPGSGIAFHPHRIGLRSAEQIKTQAQQALYVWYQQKASPHIPKNLEDMREGDYMLACWKHRYWKQPLEELAKESGLKLPFLQNWWNLLNSVTPESRFLDLVRVPWREVSGPKADKPGQALAEAEKQIAQIEADLLSWNDPKRPGKGVQRRQQDADGVRTYTMSLSVKGKSLMYLALGDLGDGNRGDIALIDRLQVQTTKGALDYVAWLDNQIAAQRKELASQPKKTKRLEMERRLKLFAHARSAFGKHPKGREVDPKSLALQAPQTLVLPVPDHALQVRAPTKLDLKNPDAKHATIQWTLKTERPRKVRNIYPGVLTVWKRGSDAQRRTMSDFGVMKQAFPDMFERRLEEVADNLHRTKPGYTVYYLSEVQLKGLLGLEEQRKLEAMKVDWTVCSSRKPTAEQAKRWDAGIWTHLSDFAHRAWRRPLGKTESAGLRALYADGVAKGVGREAAAREVLVRILVSPHFLYKAETLPGVRKPEGGDVPLSSWELASRLSFFLWGSIPDWRLRQAAADGSLKKPEVLAAHAKRMLTDAKSEALADEFAGQWLKFSGFEDQAEVDEKKFPEFTAEIRADMHREVREFFKRLVREDRSISDIVVGDYTFLNERLALFYGVPDVKGNEFRQVKVAQHDRGGLLGMGAILTGTSRPHRTSPVLRGDYLYQVVLGHTAPPPPANVPELPESADKPASLREALMQHREDQACSVCHDRIDPLGFALEGFDPIGRLRLKDESGDEIDNTGALKDGAEFRGLSGLRQYLHENQAPFTEQFCRKLLGYALGRQILPTDRGLLQEMQDALRQSGGQFSAAVLKVVSSRQFLNRRGEATVASAP